MARLYREAPLNAIWEGTSNMMCMDVLRSTAPRSRSTAEAFMAEVTRAKGADRHLDRWLDRLGTEIARPRNDDGHARRLCNSMAYALQASELHAARRRRRCSRPSAGPACRATGATCSARSSSTPELKGIVERATVVRH